MKKSITTLLTALAVSSGAVMAQQDGKFFEKVDFRGAMGTHDWSQGWSNMRPDTVKYAGDVNAASKTRVDLNVSDAITYITTNTTWTKDKVYYLSNRVIVKNGATLTIEPGTVIRGSKSGNTRAGMLIISRGAKLMAVGTKEEPIVFTSAKDVGERLPGEWGGVLLLGKARQADNGASRGAQNEGVIDNITYTSSVYETFHTDDPDAADLRFGGINDDDNSGVMKYVRIEFGGWYKVLGEEINGVTMAGVGRGTTLDYIQTSYINDDSFEWYGGTVNAKHLISIGAADDDFDTDLGATPKLQFCFSVRSPRFFESTGGSRGIEADGNSDLTYANEIDPNPKSQPIFCNMTCVGPVYPGKDKSQFANISKFDFGVIIRTNSEAKIFNSIITNFPSGSLRIRHASAAKTPSAYDKAIAGKISFENNILAGSTGITGSADNVPTNVEYPSGAGASKFDTKAWVFKNNNAAKIDTMYKNSVDLKLTHPMVDTNFVKPGTPVVSNTTISVKPMADSPILTDVNLKADFSNALFTNDSYLALGISTESFTNGEVTLYPNPSKGSSNIKVELYKAAEIEVVITDILGSEVFKAKRDLTTETQFFTVDNLKSGLYIVKVSDGIGFVGSKLVVE